IKEERNLNFDIEVDGGINEETVKLCREAGATVAVSGSYVFNSVNDTYLEKIKSLQ
ncbi:ribulose-phosphate 3-epimerase, partial [Ligilactobacillus salivarius]|nr:ribulose-phosphate 3-epimerase [Ligilactobacillus salivarius]